MNLTYKLENTRAILIGTSIYQDTSFQPIRPVDKNISVLKEILKDKSIFGLGENHIFTFLNRNHQEVQSNIIKMLSNIENSDIETLIIYFSGHGYRQGKELYLLTKNSEIDLIESSSIKFNWLKDIVQDSQVPKRILIIDSCYSGLSTMSNKDGNEKDEEVNYNIKGTFTLSSSGSDSESYFNNTDSHTFFSNELIRFFRKGDAKGGEFLTLDDCYTFLRSQFSRNSKYKNLNINPKQISNFPIPTNEFCFCKNVKYKSQEFTQDNSLKDTNPEIDKQVQIWSKWILAKAKLIEKNSEEIDIVNYEVPKEFKDDDESIRRLKFKVNLKHEINPEYRILKELLNKDLNIQVDFDDSGCSFMNYNDIFRGLDLVLSKNEIGDIIQRQEEIGCILKINPFSNFDVIKSELETNDPKIRVVNSNRSNEIKIVPTEKSSNELFNLPITTVKKYNLRLSSLLAEYTLIDKDGIVKYDLREKKIDRNEHNLQFIKKSFYRSLLEYRTEFLEKYEKVRFRVAEFYKHNNPTSSNSFLLWDDLRRDFYGFEFEVLLNDSEETLYFEFVTYDELVEKFNKIQSLRKFKIAKNPLDNDFKFKVKTEIITAKSIKGIFLEKLRLLHGIDFYAIDEKDSDNNRKGRKRNFRSNNYIGSLLSKESDYNSLVFNLTNRNKKDKVLFSKFNSYIKDEPKIKSVIPNLRGDWAKISWLQESIGKLIKSKFDVDGKPVNNRLKEFIFDSSKAKALEATYDPSSKEWKEIVTHQLLQLNDSQRQAVVSAVYSDDLSLLQGPPGTGKTTVIAEIIWQILRDSQNKRILLTSETNLAVDNALEKLLSTKHTIVKPLRYGRSERFEKEGKKYSIENIYKWIDEEYNDDIEYEKEIDEEMEDVDEMREEDVSNIVQLWMRRIAENAQNSNTRYTSVLKDWVTELAMPSKDTKEIFADKYFKHVNVIGSTSSSSGSPSFGYDYHRIFSGLLIANDYRYYKNRSKEIINFHKTNTGKRMIRDIPSIKFDTVITDEASKATPPELMMPMCYGLKNIIIGDHRQLPPMIHERDFIELLESIDEKELSKEISQTYISTSQFERLITNPKIASGIKSSFNIQYRMHPKINNVIKQFYKEEGGLSPGNEIIENADDPNLENPFSRYHGFKFRNILKPNIHTMWIDVKGSEEPVGTSRVNLTEIDAIKAILNILKKSEGFDSYMEHWENIRNDDKRKEEKEIGIISFYGQQVSKINLEIGNYSSPVLGIPVRIKTVDKFQGMERNIVIVSTVRSNLIKRGKETIRNREIGFARSPQRLNVALSRARRLLIVVGNKDFFYNYKSVDGKAIYKPVIDEISKEGNILDYENIKSFSND